MKRLLVQLTAEMEREFEKRFLSKTPQTDCQMEGKNMKMITPMTAPSCKERFLQSEKKIRISRLVHAIRRLNALTGGVEKKAMNKSTSTVDNTSTIDSSNQKKDLEIECEERRTKTEQLPSRISVEIEKDQGNTVNKGNAKQL